MIAKAHGLWVLLTVAVLTATVGAPWGELAAATAGEWEVSGWVEAELRVFPEDGQFEGQLEGTQASLLIHPHFRYESEDGRHQFKLAPYLRLDAEDDERTHFDLREAYWRHNGRRWETVAGINRVFWGVTESRHLVDIVNQVDVLEDLDEEDRLGQPMIELSVQQSWGRLSGLVLLGFRERQFPGPRGRLRPALPVEEREHGGWREDDVDFALRYAHFLGDWDIGVSYFHGTNREPRLVSGTEGGHLVAVYGAIQQLGLDLQLTRDAWLWKLETIGRRGEQDNFVAAVGGFEYTWYQVGAGGLDIGLLFEYLYDGRDKLAPPTPFENDLFVGTRLGFNDSQDTQLLLGAILDRDYGDAMVSLEFERRIGERFKLDIEGRWISDPEQSDPLSSYENDSHLSVAFSIFL